MSIQAQLRPTTDADRFADDVETRLPRILETQIRTAATPRMATLWRQIAESTVGGKRTRPMLVHLGYQVVADGWDARLVDLGCAFELLHTALVIHDDIIDQDFLRRGQPTLSAYYRDAALAQGVSGAAAEHVGNSVALLAGDALLSQAINLAHTASADSPNANAIMDVFHTAIQDSAAGELDDLLLSAHLTAASLDDVLGMHRLKTAAYSFHAPLVTGALLAGASEDVVGRLGNFANLLGACYQIIDDVLGTFGDAETTGKPNDSDLREGKVTVLIALAEAIDTAAPVVAGWRRGEVSNAAMRALLITHDIEATARRLADECCTRARQQLAALELTDETRDMLATVIDDLLRRKH